jgi:transcriptional repressor NrdR
MRCPRCSHPSDRVVDSRVMPQGDAIRRRRECEQCGHRFTTYERVEIQPLLVVKKDGVREAFLADKLLNGMLKALHRRPVPADVCHEFVSGLEQKLADAGVREITSAELGDKVMEFLKRQDHIAYVRFASVYREFRDITELLQEVRGLAEAPPEEPEP